MKEKKLQQTEQIDRITQLVNEIFNVFSDIFFLSFNFS